MAGTILITGSNGSLALPTIHHLLANYPDYTLLLSVRNVSDADSNTARLRTAISQHPDAKAVIRQLDLSSLAAVNDFAIGVAGEITDGKLPKLASIVCNAFYWNLAGDMEHTADGFEKTFHIIHVAHATLVLQLLGSFKENGRVVLLSSDAHWPGKNSLEKYPPAIPDNLDLLVEPNPDGNHDPLGRGVQRYGVAKLAVVMWMYELNRHLEKDPHLSTITAVAINPGNLSDSRALRVNTPKMLQYMSKLVIQPLRPLLRFMDPTMRTSGEAGRDIAKLATNNAFPGERGYFTLLHKDESSPDSKKEVLQQRLWKKTLEWGRITSENTALKTAFD